MPAAPLRVTARHIQLLRALFAAVAALMITFSPDHSHEVGLAVFGGFAVATALVFAVAAWLVGPRVPMVVLALLSFAAGMTASAVTLRSQTLFFVTVLVWALVSGAVELASGIAQRRAGGRGAGRDAIFVGALTVILGVALLLVSPEYALDYAIETNAGEVLPFTLTGITIAVGVLGGYAAIVAVYLGIAGLSPAAKDDASAEEAVAVAAAQEDRP